MLPFNITLNCGFMYIYIKNISDKPVNILEDKLKLSKSNM